MAQYSKVIASAADISAFTFEGGHTPTFLTRDGVTCFEIIPYFNFQWDAPGAVADVDYYCRWSNNHDDRLNRYGGPAARMGGLVNDSDAYVAARGNDYSLVHAFKIPADVSLGTIDSGIMGEFFWTRLYVSGTAIKIKVWNGNLEDEPGGLNANTDWDIEATDSDYSAAGHVGFASINMVDEQEAFFAEFHVGTNGDPAPVSEWVSPALSGATASSIQATQFTPQVDIDFP